MPWISSFMTFLMYGSRLMEKGRNILRSATLKFLLWYDRNVTSFFSSLSSSMSGSRSFCVGIVPLILS